MTTTTTEQQLTELGYDYRDGSWCYVANMPMETYWQCDVRDDSYSMSATCYRGVGSVGIVGVSAHFPLCVPAAAAMSYLTKQINMSNVAHAQVCAAR
jgi:hypothetical protein